MNRKRQWIAIGSVAALLLALVGAAVPGWSTAAQEGGAADFSVTTSVTDNGAADNGAAVAPMQLDLPQTAQVGELVTFTVRDEGAAPGAAGFLMTLEYDEAGLDFYRAEVASDRRGQGFEVLEIGPVRQDGRVTFGFVTCPAADCAATDYTQAQTSSLAADRPGNGALAQLHFYVRTPGRHTLAVSQAQRTGLAGGLPAADLQTPQALTPTPMDLRRLDLTQNGRINDADAWTAIGAWQDLLPVGQCSNPAVAHYDVDGSGCIDLPDFQMILAYWGAAAPFPQGVASEPDLPQEIASVEAPLTLTVNDAGDEADANPGNGVCATSTGRCTLRAAIQESNVSTGRDTILFNVRNADGSCPTLVAIQPTTSLHVDDSRGYGAVIDGYSQCGAAVNTQAVHGNAVIKVEIRGNQTAGVYGLFINSQNNVVRGLAIFNFNNQILLRGTRSHHNFIEGNFIGTNAANTHTTNFPGENNGVYADRGAAFNTIGGATVDKRNLVSGNDQDGVNLQGVAVTGHVVIGNYIGLKQDGVASLRNSSDGVDLAEGAYGNRVGGATASERNVISGNGGDGIEISHSGAHDNEVTGNYIGLNATGTAITRNNKIGITHEDVVTNNRIHRNIIVGNGGHGVRVYTANSNQIYANFIGAYPPGMGPGVPVPDPGDVALTGLIAAPNGALSNGSGKSGVHVMGGSQATLISGNVIANQPEYGVAISAEKGYLAIGTCETYFNTISENSIFNNGLKGIGLLARTCEGVSFTGNQGLSRPTIRTARTNQVSGTTCANCTVEVFIADKTQVNSPSDNNGEGMQLIGRGMANGSGSFTVTVSGVAAGQLVTATATHASGNTSEFARNVAVAAGSASDPEVETSTFIYLPTIMR